MDKIFLFGASGHGRVLYDLVTSSGLSVDSFIDDNPEIHSFMDTPVIRFEKLNRDNLVPGIISIGDNRIRKSISTRITNPYAQLFHPTALIFSGVNILEGTVVMPRVVVNSGVSIGKHVILNTAAIIEHDCLIEDFVHISPGSIITGGVTVKEGTHIGAGSVVIPNITIGKWCTVGAGAVITKDIPDYAVVVGNPGRIIKYNVK